MKHSFFRYLLLPLALIALLYVSIKNIFMGVPFSFTDRLIYLFGVSVAPLYHYGLGTKQEKTKPRFNHEKNYFYHCFATVVFGACLGFFPARLSFLAITESCLGGLLDTGRKKTEANLGENTCKKYF